VRAHSPFAFLAIKLFFAVTIRFVLVAEVDKKGPRLAAASAVASGAGGAPCEAARIRSRKGGRSARVEAGND